MDQDCLVNGAAAMRLLAGKALNRQVATEKLARGNCGHSRE